MTRDQAIIAALTGGAMDTTNIPQTFLTWFKNSGHWIYPSMRAAFDMWRDFGIEGLPDYNKAIKGN